jgi:hypothetical protein
VPVLFHPNQTIVISTEAHAFVSSAVEKSASPPLPFASLTTHLPLLFLLSSPNWDLLCLLPSPLHLSVLAVILTVSEAEWEGSRSIATTTCRFHLSAVAFAVGSQKALSPYSSSSHSGPEQSRTGKEPPAPLSVLPHSPKTVISTKVRQPHNPPAVAFPIVIADWDLLLSCFPRPASAKRPPPCRKRERSPRPKRLILFFFPHF